MVENVMHATVELAVRQADDPSEGAPLLTVIVPVYNEEGTISELLARVISATYSKQVIVVDDGSTDGTADALRIWQGDARIEVLRHDVTRGAGAAIRTALPHARGRFTIIQDADLEYDPEDYPRLIGPLLAGDARAVFGSRYLPETPSEPLWRRMMHAARAMKASVRNAIDSFATSTMNALKWGLRVRMNDVNVQPSQATDSEVHPTQVAGSQVSLARRRLAPWGLRRFGAAALKLTARMLYHRPLSDVSGSLKAFSTGLLRNLDLQCEHFEFGPEVTAKLCRAGEKIIEVPVHYESRIGHRSWIMERFAPRPAAMHNRFSGQSLAGKKHRWNDGLHALNTLWRWRYWTMPVPDPERIPAAAPAADAAYTRKSMAGEKVSAGVQTNLDQWAEEDSKRSDFDEAAWNDPARPHPADSSVESLVEEVLAANAEVREGRSFVAAAFAFAAANFEARLMWDRFAKKSASKSRDDSDETDTGQDWEHWGLPDLLLLLAIVNIGLVLLVTLITPFSSWSGLVLAAIVSAVTFRTTRAGKFEFDKCNRAFGILTVLLVCSMIPSSWVWRGRTMLILAALALLAGLFRLRSKGIRQLDRSFLDAIGAMAFFFAGMHVTSPDLRTVELLVLLVSVTLFIGVHRRRKMRHSSDNVLLVLSTTGIFFVVVFSYLFPIDLSRLSWWESWLRFRYAVLPHWTELWWFRWGIVAALAAMVAALLISQTRRSEA